MGKWWRAFLGSGFSFFLKLQKKKKMWQSEDYGKKELCFTVCMSLT